MKDLSLLTADVSVAFMHAPVEAEACDLVLLPANLTIKGCRVIAWLGKAMNGLRRAHCCGFSNCSGWYILWEVKTPLRIFIQVADAQWNAFSAGVRRRLTRRG